MQSDIDSTTNSVIALIQKILELNSAVENIRLNKIQIENDRDSRQYELAKRNLEDRRTGPTEQGYRDVIRLGQQEIENIEEELATKQRDLGQDLAD